MSKKEIQKGKTLAEIIAGKDYPLIEFRCRYQLKDGTKRDDFFGWASYINGKLESLDCESYSLKVVCQNWEEWENDNGETCLTVWEEVDMVEG